MMHGNMYIKFIDTFPLEIIQDAVNTTKQFDYSFIMRETCSVKGPCAAEVINSKFLTEVTIKTFIWDLTPLNGAEINRLVQRNFLSPF
jgi:hypothetical protein